MSDMTRDEMSLLLYLETCAVDQSGAVDDRKINADDREIIARWCGTGFIESGRIASRLMSDGSRILGSRNGSTWVRLSEGAWAQAHLLRRQRAERTWKNRPWETTAEKRAGA